jgi:hypothetical protein
MVFSKSLDEIGEGYVCKYMLYILTDRYDRTEILLKVVLNTITLTLTDCVSSLCFLCLSLNVVIGVLKIYNIYLQT